MTIDVAADGSYSQRVELRARVQSTAGVQQVGTLVVPFSKALGTTDFEYVRVRKPSGQIVETPVSTAMEVPAPVTRVAPTYTDLYMKHVNVQGLAVGDTLEYASRTAQKALLPGHFAYEYQFPPLPIALAHELYVSFPSQMKATVKTRGAQPEITNEGDRRRYAWKRASLSRPTDNELMKLMYGLKDLRPDVQITTFASWSDLGETVRKLWADRTVATPAVRAKAQELTTALKNDEARVRALYAFVATKIRYVSVSIGVGRLQPHAADEVLANGFGDCKDKHVLLAALLSTIGVDAHAALIGVEEGFDAEVPSSIPFNHVITSMTLGGRDVWLDATLEVAPFGHLTNGERDKDVLLIRSRGAAGLAKTPKDAGQADAMRLTIEGTISDTGRLDAAIEAVYGGDSEVLMRSIMRATGPNEWPELLKANRAIASVTGAASDITTSPVEDTSSAFTVKYKFVAPVLPEWSKLTVRALLLGIDSAPDDDAVVPVLVSASRRETIMRLRLPAGMVAKLEDGTDSDVSIKEAWGDFSQRTRLAGDLYEVHQIVDRRGPELPVDQFASYRAFEKRVNALGDSVTLSRRAPWAFADSSTIDWYEGASSATVTTLREIADQGRRGDTQGALRRMTELAKLNPDVPVLSLMLAWAELSSGNRGRAVEILKQQTARNPTPSTYKLLARYQWMDGSRAASAETLANGRLRYPDDREFPLYLGETYVTLGRFADALKLLEGELSSESDSARLHLNLGKAHIGAGASEKGVEALRKVASLDGSAYALNNTAWALAEAGLALDEAIEMSRGAVTEVERSTSGISLATLTDAQLRQMMTLATYWDTLAWAYFKKGDHARAEPYLLASWDLTHRGIYADHLGDLYRSRKDAASAASFYARASVTSPAEPAAAAKLRAVVGDSARADAAQARERAGLSALRTFAVPRLADAKGTAEAFVLIEPGGKVADVRFISGSDTLRPSVELLRTAAIPSHMPGTGDARVVRRVVLTCTGAQTCQAILLTADVVTSVR